MFSFNRIYYWNHLVCDHRLAKEDIEIQATFEEELSSMDAVLEKAKECLEDGGTLTVPILKALIKSKGSGSFTGQEEESPIRKSLKKAASQLILTFMI